jgi:hypothetical protein
MTDSRHPYPKVEERNDAYLELVTAYLQLRNAVLMGDSKTMTVTSSAYSDRLDGVVELASIAATSQYRAEMALRHFSNLRLGDTIRRWSPVPFGSREFQELPSISYWKQAAEGKEYGAVVAQVVEERTQPATWGAERFVDLWWRLNGEGLFSLPEVVRTYAGVLVSEHVYKNVSPVIGTGLPGYLDAAVKAGLSIQHQIAYEAIADKHPDMVERFAKQGWPLHSHMLPLASLAIWESGAHHALNNGGTDNYKVPIDIAGPAIRFAVDGWPELRKAKLLETHPATWAMQLVTRGFSAYIRQNEPTWLIERMTEQYGDPRRARRALIDAVAPQIIEPAKTVGDVFAEVGVASLSI